MVVASSLPIASCTISGARLALSSSLRRGVLPVVVAVVVVLLLVSSFWRAAAVLQWLRRLRAFCVPRGRRECTPPPLRRCAPWQVQRVEVVLVIIWEAIGWEWRAVATSGEGQEGLLQCCNNAEMAGKLVRFKVCVWFNEV